MVMVQYSDQILLAMQNQAESIRIMQRYADHYASGYLTRAEQDQNTVRPDRKIIVEAPPPAQQAPPHQARTGGQQPEAGARPGVGVPKPKPGGPNRARDSGELLTIYKISSPWRYHFTHGLKNIKT